jgi:predicted nuclease of predicted toxin-antitoxin system
MSRFKLDENLPAEVAQDLRDLGHDADTVHDEGLTGIVDLRLFERAVATGRTLLTLDKGLGDVRLYDATLSAGIVLFRPHTSGRRAVIAFIRRHLRTLTELDCTGTLVVISETGIRIRRPE